MPIKVYIQEEEAIWKNNHLPAVDIDERHSYTYKNSYAILKSKKVKLKYILYCCPLLPPKPLRFLLLAQD